MAESLHMGMSPYAKDAEIPIIDKKAKNWESVLLQLAACSLLLPSAAQAIITGLIGLSFLGMRRWTAFKAPDPTVKRIGMILLQALILLWFLLGLHGIYENFFIGPGAFSQHLRLIGKQGFYGCFLIASFCALQLKERDRKSVVNIGVLLVFSVLYLLYCTLQWKFGWDWVHGFGARLPENRFAYGVYRVSGLMGHPLTLANNALLVALLGFAQGLWLRAEARVGESRAWFALALVALAIIYISGSRFPLILALLIPLFVILPRIGWKKLLLGNALLLLLLVLAFVFTDPSWGRWGELFDSNLAWEKRFDRLIFWKVHLQMFWDSPWGGTGLGSYDARLLDTYAQAGYTSLERKYNAHNIYLQTLAEFGIIGGAGLLLLFGGLVRIAILARRRFEHQGLFLLLLATALGGIAQNNLRDSEYLSALWTSIGICLAYLIGRRRWDESSSREQLEDSQS